MKYLQLFGFAIIGILFAFAPKKAPLQLFLVGDSTVADYSLEPDYLEKRFPLTDWGQVFQPFLEKDSLAKVKNLVKSNQVIVIDKAKGGRSTRTFFEEGKWVEVVKMLRKNDLVMIQFGHNDASVEKPERYVNVNGYKEYLRLYVKQARENGAIPILLTPVARNYPWSGGKLSNVHGDYPAAVKQVAEELEVKIIDLNQLSIDAFSAKGQKEVSDRYFMNFEKGVFPAYPNGQKDNTHFQQAGARLLAQLVFTAMKKL